MPHPVDWVGECPPAGPPISDMSLMLLVLPQSTRFRKHWGSNEGLTAPGLAFPHALCIPRVTSTPSVLCLPVQLETPLCCGCQWRPSLQFSPSTLRAWFGWCRSAGLSPPSTEPTHHRHRWTRTQQSLKLCYQP